jgi:hypothetical protein
LIKGGGFVPNELEKKRKKQDQNATNKLLAISGVKEAIKMVRRYALKGAIEDASVRQYIHRLPREDADQFILDDSTVDYDLSDKLLESLAWKAGPKIAELWNLSETAGGRLTEVIYWGQYILFGEKMTYGEDDYFKSLVIVANMKEPKAIRKLSREEYEFISKNTTIVSRKGMLPNHIYLDVTYLPYDSLHIAYRSAIFCRQWLGLQKKDLREGAPETFDAAKAIRCAELADAGKSGKEIARELGFQIYTVDIRSGTYPLFRKYLKKGRELRVRLTALEDFLEAELSFLLVEYNS